MKIAVDAMGADYGPGPVIEGVVMALSDYPEYEFVLVGHSAKLPFYLEKYGIAGHPRISIVHAETVCEMSEPSTIALRAKKDSSITTCARLLKAKDSMPWSRRGIPARPSPRPKCWSGRCPASTARRWPPAFRLKEAAASF